MYCNSQVVQRQAVPRHEDLLVRTSRRIASRRDGPGRQRTSQTAVADRGAVPVAGLRGPGPRDPHGFRGPGGAVTDARQHTADCSGGYDKGRLTTLASRPLSYGFLGRSEEVGFRLRRAWAAALTLGEPAPDAEPLVVLECVLEAFAPGPRTMRRCAWPPWSILPFREERLPGRSPRTARVPASSQFFHFGQRQTGRSTPACFLHSRAPDARGMTTTMKLHARK